MIIIKDKGKNIFHLSFINISYRNRGYDPRTQINRIVIEINMFMDVNLFNDLKNIKIEIILRISILIYSARKIIANHPPIYSTLNPETNSDSPSAKSKGLRLVSAKQEVIQMKNKIMFPQKK